MTGPTANESVMMQVNGVGVFVRALLPVRLSGGHSVTFGVWVAVAPAELQRVFEVWWKPEYAHLTLEVTLNVLDPDQTPYCVSSNSSGLNAVLSEEWAQKEVLDALP